MNSSPYRVLYVERPFQVGGSVISLYELVKRLDKSLFEPIVLFHGPNPYRQKFWELGVETITLSDQVPKAITGEGIRDIAANLDRYHQVLGNGYRTAKQWYLVAKKDFPLARRVAGLIRAKNIALVHHNGCLARNRDTILAGLQTNVAQVVHVRTLHAFGQWEKLLARSVDFFVYISRAVEQFYQDLGIPPYLGKVVHNPFDVSAFSAANHSVRLRQELGVDKDDFLISNVGRIDWWKGQDDFIEALAKVANSNPQVKGAIIGSPEPTVESQLYYKKLQHLVAALQLEGKVIFTGFRSDIPALMAASNVVVHSASVPEPFGRVIVEGMAAGRPVIATAAGGVLDIIQPSVNGLLVPPRAPGQMAEAILRLMNNPQEARAMGQCAQQYVQENFSAERHVKKIEGIYNRIVSQRKSYLSLEKKSILESL